MICLNLFKIIGQMDITVAAITELILLTRTFRTKLILSTDSLKSSQQKVLIVFFFNFFFLVISLLFYLFFTFIYPHQSTNFCHYRTPPACIIGNFLPHIICSILRKSSVAKADHEAERRH